MKTKNTITNNNYYFPESEVLYYIRKFKKEPDTFQNFDRLHKILRDLNLRILNKFLPYYQSKYNLVQNDKFFKIEKEELLQEIIFQQISSLKRFDENSNTKIFSFLTAIQENVIKYRVQILVKETNYFTYNVDNYENYSEFVLTENDPVQEIDNDDKTIFEVPLYEYISSNGEDTFIHICNKYKSIIEKIYNQTNVNDNLVKLLVLNRYLLYYYYRSNFKKRKYNKKNKKFYIFEIEKKLKQDFILTQMFGFKQSSINIDIVYKLFNET